MKRLSNFFVVMFFVSTTQASDSLVVLLNTLQFNKGDIINIDGNFLYSDKASAAVTLNVWIENIEHTSSWKYRYPIINGKVEADLIISNNIPSGKYAINFLVQKDFVKIKGVVKDYNVKSKGLLYLMMSRDKSNYINNVLPDEEGNFNLGKMVFPDTACFVFSNIGKRKNDLNIQLVTTIDSAFTPIFSTTKIITIGQPIYTKADTLQPYTFDFLKLRTGFTLDNVTVTTTRKSRVEQFDEEVASEMFSGGAATIFDGLTDNRMASATDIFSFLQGQVAGLDIKHSPETGGYTVLWRKSQVDVYLDEFKIDASDPLMVNPADVAMIKIFRPGEGGPTNSGTIAIYTKRGNYLDNASRRYNFFVKGFTPLSTIWK